MLHFIFEVLPLLSSNGIVSEAFDVRAININEIINFIPKYYTPFIKYKSKGELFYLVKNVYLILILKKLKITEIIS